MSIFVTRINTSMKFNSILLVLPILTVLMFDLGLSLRVSDFVNIFKKPKAMLTGLFGQLVLLPLIALGLANVCRLQPEFFIGLMLIACCPGGSSSNIFSKLAKGDVALSVSSSAIRQTLISSEHDRFFHFQLFGPREMVSRGISRQGTMSSGGSFLQPRA